MAKSFTAQVDDQVKMVERRLKAVTKNATLDVVNVAQRPTAKGGKMPVKTSFLRSSGRMSLDGMPAGPRRGEEGVEYEYSDSDTLLIIAEVEAGDVIHFGWTAAYARRMEAKYGFQRGAAGQWKGIVNKHAERAKRLIK